MSCPKSLSYFYGKRSEKLLDRQSQSKWDSITVAKWCDMTTPDGHGNFDIVQYTKIADSAEKGGDFGVRLRTCGQCYSDEPATKYTDRPSLWFIVQRNA